MSRHGNEAFDKFKTPWAETYPGLLRAEGYWVGHVGKWHNGPFPRDRFDFGRSYSGTHWIARPKAEPVHVTQQNEAGRAGIPAEAAGRQAVLPDGGLLRPARRGRQPEAIPAAAGERQAVRGCRGAGAGRGDRRGLRRLPPFLQRAENEGRKRWAWRFDTPDKYQAMMKNYYRLCTEVDATCGRVLAELKEQGILDDTLVVFTGDNGYFHGERGLADKWYPYEESIRVPLIVRDPRLPKAARGRTNDDFVLNVDIAPTILAAANVAAPATMQGRDFAPLFLSAKKPEPPWRDEFFYEHAVIGSKERIPSSQALVRRDAKYIVWPDYEYEELFDLKADPAEQKNLAADPAREATRRDDETARATPGAGQMTDGEEDRYRPGDLVEYAAGLFAAAGCDSEKPAVIAAGLVEADLLGHTTHGLHLAAPYLGELAAGRMTAVGEPDVVADRGAAVTWDGRRLPGIWLTAKAVELAVERVAAYGVVTVAIRRSHHIGCLAAFLERATDRGLMVVVASSDPAAASVAPFGGRKAVFTPDPLAVGIPTDGDPILIDISASITTNGMAGRLRAEGRRFPGPWALDAAGRPTDDPAVLSADPPGTLLPAGGTDHGHKGYGLALLVEALTQGLGGSGRAERPAGWGASVFVQVLDPAAFGGAEAFRRETGWTAAACRANPPAPGVEAVRLPGQRGLERKRRAAADGVALYPGVMAALAPFAEKYGVAPPRPLPK